MSRVSEALDAHDRGWLLTPLNGKIPRLKKWPELPAPTREQVASWAAQGNVGVRTGNGIVVVDVDVGAPPEWFEPRNTPTARTPRGGRHYYYAAPDPCPPNTASKLAPHVDTRGVHGQVVLVGAEGYTWEVPPTVALAPFPYTIPSKRAEVALEREAASVALAPEGTRNDALNRAAFNLGTLVGAGELAAGEVTRVLEQAASSAGLEHQEIDATLRSGLGAGERHPRQAPKSIAVVVQNSRRRVLCPGIHTWAARSERIGSDAFAKAVMAALPFGLLYRQGGVVGTIDTDFRPLTGEGLRLISDAHVEIEQHSIKKDQEHVSYIPMTDDLAGLVLSEALSHQSVRDLRAVVPHPVVTETGVLGGGWHPEFGICSTWNNDLGEPEEPWALLHDFPLDPVSRANFVALLLTPLVRPALDGNVPVFVVTSPVAGSGKTKLIDEILGPIVLGEGVPTMMWPKDEDEVRKTITAALMSGPRILSLDNVPGELSSPTLAALTTTERWRDRVLGHTTSAVLYQTLTLCVTGNHVEASGEMARRAVRIVLNPGLDNPEFRTGWKHKNLRAAARDARPRVLAWLLGLHASWMRAGSPQAKTVMGSFERWTGLVCAILEHAGLPVLGKDQPSLGDIDAERQDLVQLWTTWKETHGDAWLSASQVRTLAEATGVWEPLLSSRPTDRARDTVVGCKLRRLTGRVIDDRCLEAKRVKNGPVYRLAGPLA